MYKRKEELCKYNENVECREGNCLKCGWNPKVAKKRLERIRAKLIRQYKGKEVWQYE